ncbi:hypothetical protein F4553_005243 [Allocatelliglobosispora scoriae]|uniref:YCII-related domain-containing protein n=1 Tax=Allocatelliglobosispora scoriae TaxID=643052 RepID=A0A841BUI3_9ACTN|nr:YciI family protein [Allocatelliglobosispora scoriae]MBB5871864.1 hypothetical protein [Allocatelliglobosispora scoriae]
MKYMIILYGNQELWNSFPPEQWAETIAEFDAFNNRHFQTGELLGAYGMADAKEAKKVRVRDGAPVVTDGPYLETKEYLASWYLIDVPTEARALAIAAEIPSASLADVEVWPITHEAAKP